MNKFVSILCLMFIITGCGDDGNPANSGQPVADQTVTLPGGTEVDFSFTVNTDIQQNVFLQGQFSVDGGNVEMAVLNESEYQTWRSGGTPGVLYSPGATAGASFRLPIEDSDTYYVVFRNRNSDPVTVKAEIFLQSTSDAGEEEV